MINMKKKKIYIIFFIHKNVCIFLSQRGLFDDFKVLNYKLVKIFQKMKYNLNIYISIFYIRDRDYNLI